MQIHVGGQISTASGPYVLNLAFILLTTKVVFCAKVYIKIWCFVQKESQIVFCAKTAPTSGGMCNFLGHTRGSMPLIPTYCE